MDHEQFRLGVEEPIVLALVQKGFDEGPSRITENRD
jgi:hypothetical protein